MMSVGRNVIALSLVATLWPDFAAAQKAGVVTALEGNVTATRAAVPQPVVLKFKDDVFVNDRVVTGDRSRSEEHTSELQSRFDLVCRLMLEKKKRQPTVPRPGGGRVLGGAGGAAEALGRHEDGDAAVPPRREGRPRPAPG